VGNRQLEDDKFAERKYNAVEKNSSIVVVRNGKKRQQTPAPSAAFDSQ